MAGEHKYIFKVTIKHCTELFVCLDQLLLLLLVVGLSVALLLSLMMTMMMMMCCLRRKKNQQNQYQELLSTVPSVPSRSAPVILVTQGSWTS